MRYSLLVCWVMACSRLTLSPHKPRGHVIHQLPFGRCCPLWSSMLPCSAQLPNRRFSWQECWPTLNQLLHWQKSLLGTGLCHLHRPSATQADGHKPKYARQQDCTWGWSSQWKMCLSYVVLPPIKTTKAHCCVMGGAAKELPSYSNAGIHSTVSDLEVGVRMRKSRKEHCVSL